MTIVAAAERGALPALCSTSRRFAGICSDVNFWRSKLTPEQIARKPAYRAWLPHFLVESSNIYATTMNDRFSNLLNHLQYSVPTVRQIEDLLIKGADIEATDLAGTTMLHDLCALADPPLPQIDFLLRNGASANTEDVSGELLYMDIQLNSERSLELIQLLVNYQMNYALAPPPDEATPYAITAVQRLADGARATQLLTVMEQAGLNIRAQHTGFMRHNALLHAALLHKPVILQHLISRGLVQDLYFTNQVPQFFTAFHVVSKKEEDGEQAVQVVQRLYGARPGLIDTPSGDGKTPLHLAVMSGLSLIAQALLENGAQPIRFENRSILELALDLDNGVRYVMVQMLLENNANPLERTSNGLTIRQYLSQKTTIPLKFRDQLHNLFFMFGVLD